MAFLSIKTCVTVLVTLICVIILPIVANAGNFEKNFRITWGNERVKMLDNGKHLRLSLDSLSGSGFESKSRYLYGKFDMKVKLVTGNSAGTVTTFFLASGGPVHDEIDWEFLGNVTGEPYTIHTNVYSQGKGDREKQFRLWFDPTIDYHTYSITWNPANIIFSIDGIPIREFKNMNSIGVPYPTSKPMKVYASLWNADDWATQGGRVKTDWNQSPFIASYSDFRITACKSSPRASNCQKESEWKDKELNSIEKERMQSMQRKYMIYDYCTDKARFPQGLPPECNLP